MKIFVAGATGVLGRPVVRLLVGRGHEVRGLARSDSNVEALRRLGAEPASADLFDSHSLEKAARGCEVVLHLATAIPTRRRTRLRDFALNDRIRVEGTENLLKAALTCRARRYVQQSVAGLHHSEDGAWVDEEAPLRDHPVMRSALEMERMVWQVRGLDGLSSVILRGGWFYGPEAEHTRQMFAALRAGYLPLVGKGDNYWSLIHIEDMAGACVAASETPRPAGVYLVVDDEPVQVREFFAHVARSQGGRPPRTLPAWLMSLLAGPLAPDLLSQSFRCRNERIKRDLGWKPAHPTYREGVASILRAWSGKPEARARQA